MVTCTNAKVDLNVCMDKGVDDNVNCIGYLLTLNIKKTKGRCNVCR